MEANANSKITCAFNDEMGKLVLERKGQIETMMWGPKFAAGKWISEI
jgi:hypothetical protein